MFLNRFVLLIGSVTQKMVIDLFLFFVTHSIGVKVFIEAEFMQDLLFWNKVLLKDLIGMKRLNIVLYNICFLFLMMHILYKVSLV